MRTRFLMAFVGIENDVRFCKIRLGSLSFGFPQDNLIFRYGQGKSAVDGRKVNVINDLHFSAVVHYCPVLPGVKLDIGFSKLPPHGSVIQGGFPIWENSKDVVMNRFWHILP